MDCWHLNASPIGKAAIQRVAALTLPIGSSFPLPNGVRRAIPEANLAVSEFMMSAYR